MIFLRNNTHTVLCIPHDTFQKHSNVLLDVEVELFQLSRNNSIDATVRQKDSELRHRRT